MRPTACWNWVSRTCKELLETLERYDIDARYEKTGEMFVALNPESAQRLYQAEYEEANSLR